MLKYMNKIILILLTNTITKKDRPIGGSWRGRRKYEGRGSI